MGKREFQSDSGAEHSDSPVKKKHKKSKRREDGGDLILIEKSPKKEAIIELEDTDMSGLSTIHDATIDDDDVIEGDDAKNGTSKKAKKKKKKRNISSESESNLSATENSERKFGKRKKSISQSSGNSSTDDQPSTSEKKSKKRKRQSTEETSTFQEKSGILKAPSKTVKLEGASRSNAGGFPAQTELGEEIWLVEKPCSISNEAFSEMVDSIEFPQFHGASTKDCTKLKVNKQKLLCAWSKFGAQKQSSLFYAEQEDTRYQKPESLVAGCLKLVPDTSIKKADQMEPVDIRRKPPVEPPGIVLKQRFRPIGADYESKPIKARRRLKEEPISVEKGDHVTGGEEIVYKKKKKKKKKDKVKEERVSE